MAEKQVSRLYSVYLEADDIDPICLGIATSENVAIAMIELSNKEFEGMYNYHISSVIPNAIGLDDVVYHFDKSGKMIKTSSEELWDIKEVELPEYEEEIEND